MVLKLYDVKAIDRFSIYLYSFDRLYHYEKDGI